MTYTLNGETISETNARFIADVTGRTVTFERILSTVRTSGEPRYINTMGAVLKVSL